jgi:uncharacterized membrane protein YfcA
MEVSTFLLASLAVFILGMSKAGLKGLGIIVVAILANVYGAKASTGILLPLLIVGDVLAVSFYRKYVKWEYLWKFLPAMVVGVLIAVVVGKNLDENAFRSWMAVIILVSVVILLWRDLRRIMSYPRNPLFTGSMGILAGFTTMIGNLAGAFSNIYFLATQLPKNELIATAAWLFFIINLFKVPFHVFSWETITLESLWIDLTLIPAAIVGFLLGKKLVTYISEQNYRWFLLIATTLGALLLFV